MDITEFKSVTALVFLLATSGAAAYEEWEQPVLTEEEFDLEFEITSAAAAGQDTIVFPCATYLRETTVNLSNLSNICIYFEYGSKILLDDVYQTVVWMEDCENIEIYGGYFCHVEPLEFEDCHGSVFALRRSNSIFFDFCEIRGCGRIGFYVRDCANLHITNCVIEDNSKCAFYLFDADGLYVEACEITNNGELFSPSGSITGLWMTGNTVTNIGWPCYP